MFVEYMVVGGAIRISPGQIMKNLTPEQLRRRKNHVKEVKNKKDLYECVRPFVFKSGEVVQLESDAVNKRDLKILRDSSQVNNASLEELTKAQLIAWAKRNAKEVSLDMKMTRDEMLSALQ